MSWLQEFKAFAMRGNVVDLAVGVIIGGAFGAVVNSLVNDIIMPPFGQLTSGHDLPNYLIALNGRHYETLADAKKAGAAVIAYGNFLNTIVNFLIIAFAIFLMVKMINKLHRPPPPPPTLGPSPEAKLLTEIRDLLAKQAG